MPSEITFDRAIAIVLVNEGGARFTDPTIAAPTDAIANDRGGPTKFGVTLATLSAWRKKPVGSSDVRNLQESEARAIYEANYWRPLRCPELGNQGLATAVLDAGVLTGIGNAGRQLQNAVNAVLNAGLKVDGNVGPKTLAAVQQADPVQLVLTFSGLLQRFFVALIQRDASQQVFLIAWLKRAAVMQALPFLYP